MSEPIKTVNDNFVLQLLINPRYRVYRHLIIILFFVSILINGRNMEGEPATIYRKVGVFILLLGLFYLNMYQLVPKLLFRNRYTEYALSVLAVVAIAFLLFLGGRYFLRPHFVLRENKKNDLLILFNFVFIFCILIAASSAVKLFQRWVIDSQRINELEKITMHSELEQLKNQINPHFLFNMLNNANVLAQKDPEKASQVLTKLSDLLRYQLYDSTRSKVLLTADIHFLTDFLNLEKIRRDNFEFIVSKAGEISGLQIPPLLFITFVENAVKHNMDAEKPSYVHVYFDVHNDSLYFKCINSKPQQPPVKKGAGGLGLANVRRTLELLYPGKHLLSIEDKTDNYSVQLTIGL